MRTSAGWSTGEPVPTEHDAVRWLAPEELDDVDWLPGEVGFVQALRPLLLDGERLPGGNVGGAVRIGSTVRRPTGPWTGAVHDLLRHLAGTALPGVPRVLGSRRARPGGADVPARRGARPGRL